MKYRVLDGESLYKQGLLPVNLEKMQEENRLILFGSQNEDGELLSLAAFVSMPNYKDELRLEYIYTPPKFRAKGYYHDLLKFCFEHFKKRGIRSITVKICDTPDKVSDFYNFIVMEKFIPLTFDGHLLEYSLKTTLESEILNKIRDRKRSEVVTIPDREDIRLKRFCVDVQENGAFISRREYNPVFSRFCMQGNEITGAVIVEKINEKVLFISQIYLSSKNKDSNILLYLLADSIRAAGEQMPEDTLIRIQLFMPMRYQVIEKIFGKPQEDYIIQEFVYTMIE